MDNLNLPGTINTPEVAFDFDAHTLALRGESHPEDVASFYQPILDALETYLGASDAPLTFIFGFIYFNSSTAKIVMMLMEMLDDAADAGRDVTVRWEHDGEDENMQELGEEFGEDLEHARFELVALGA